MLKLCIEWLVILAWCHFIWIFFPLDGQKTYSIIAPTLRPRTTSCFDLQSILPPIAVIKSNELPRHHCKYGPRSEKDSLFNSVRLKVKENSQV